MIGVIRRVVTAERLVTVLIVAPLFVSGLWSFGGELVPAVLGTARDRGFSPELLGLALALAAVGWWTQALHFAGPLAVSAARLQWLPVDDVLRHERFLTGLAVAVVVLVLVAVVVLTARAMGWPAGILGGGTALTLVATALLTAWLQRRDAPPAVATVFLGAALVVAALQIWPAPVVLAPGAAGLRALWRRGGAGRGRPHPVVPRWQLVRGHANRWSVTAGVLSMDGDVVAAVRESRESSSRKPLPARLYGRLGLPTIVLTRVLSDTLVMTAGLLLTAVIAEHLLGAGPVVLLILQYRLTLAAGRTGESWLASPALQRIWGPVGVRLFAPVAVTGVAVTLVAFAIAPMTPAMTAMLPAVPPLVLLRRHVARRDEGLTLLATPAGPLPIQTVNRVIAGYDVLAVAQLVAISTTVAAAGRN